MSVPSVLHLVKGAHVLVRDEHENLCTDDAGNILIMDVTTQNIWSVPTSEEVLTFFTLPIAQHAPTANETVREDRDERTPWTHEEIIQLINLYEEHRALFKSSTMKQDRVWQMISKHTGRHNAEQCKNKFKYLNMKYREKKDNMGTKSSGARVVSFKYITQMDKLFGTDANITPVATASSRRGAQNLKDIANDEPDDSKNDQQPSEHNAQKRKRSRLELQLESLERDREDKEKAKERRHEELLQRQDAALAIFRDIANSLQATTKYSSN